MAARKKPASKSKKTSAQKVTPKRKVATKAKTTPVGNKSAAGRATSPLPKKVAPLKVGDKPYTKSEFINALGEQTGIGKKEIIAVLETIGKIISVHVQKQGPEIFSWPGLFKIQVVKKPATKAREGVNPLTGETMTFKAKPASRRIKIRALKQLKEMAN